MSERLPVAIAVLWVAVALCTVFEVVRFPERAPWMLGLAASFFVLSAVVWGTVRLRPGWTIPVVVAFVDVLGVGVNAYHAIVAAPVAMCIWALTAVLAGSAVMFPWGRRNTALASLGVLLTYPVHLAVPTNDALTWGAGAAYLLMVVGLSTFGSSLFSHYMENDLQLTATLSEREARLQSYFDLSLVGMAVVGADGRCDEVNAELCRMLGTTAAELLGTPWTTCVDPRDADVANGLVAQAVAGAPGRMDLRLRAASARTIDATVAVRGLPGADGTIDHAMVLVHDITERRRMESERERSLEQTEAARRHAEDASRAKDAFFATVSHELRTPLTPILAWANMLQGGNLGVTRTARAVSAIRRNAYAQARLIDDLLDMSRIVAGEWRFDFRPVDLVAITRAALDVVRPAANAKRIVLTAALPEHPLGVRGDPDRLQQVVWNLVSNAIKFTPRGGWVTVTVRRAADHVELAVEDTGEGIPPEFAPHVFEPFRQADASPSRRHAGLGLGLAIVRALVERHDGTVRGESGGHGRGAIFTIALPALPDGVPLDDGSAPDRVEPAVALMEGPRAALVGLKVLVVDDDPDSNAVVRALLTSRGAEVQTALSAADALVIAAGWRPDVVVSDIAMPGDDGVAFLGQLRARRSTMDVPAIALTAYSGGADRRQLLDAGFQAYVAKPFDPVHLAAVVETTAFLSAAEH